MISCFAYNQEHFPKNQTVHEKLMRTDITMSSHDQVVQYDYAAQVHFDKWNFLEESFA